MGKKNIVKPKAKAIKNKKSAPKKKVVTKKHLLHPADQYAKNVISGKILTSEYVKLAVNRHLQDLKDGHKRGLYFDPEAGQKVIDFFHILNHFEGDWAGQKIQLEPWQQFVLYVSYGWKRSDGTRRFRNGYLEVARKNGKSTLLGGLALYGLMLDDENAPQIWCGATKTDQAAIVVNIAGRIAKKTPALVKRLRFQEHGEKIKRVIYPDKAGYIAPLGRDSDTQDGFNPHMGIMDERHAMPTDDVPNVIKSGMGARKQPFQWSITTAGFNKTHPCYGIRKNLIQILKGEKTDDSFFAIIYTLDKEEEWEDKLQWIKANPCLGVSCSETYLIDEYNTAKNMGETDEVNFKTKNLNLWTDAAKIWMQESVWMKCKYSFPDLTKLKCYGGLDLASTRDFTALTLLFPIDGKEYYKTWFWMPEDNIIKIKEKGAPIEQWVKDGYVSITPGNVTDYDFIKRDILQFAELFSIESIAYDRYNASQLVIGLLDAGIVMTPFSQQLTVISTPTKEFEKGIYQGIVRHDGNPVMKWMISNCIIISDSNANIKIDKKKSEFKVDGPVSAVMAKGEFMTAPKEAAPTVDSW
jgi:phage terminase large subunit-like protein